MERSLFALALAYRSLARGPPCRRAAVRAASSAPRRAVRVRAPALPVRPDAAPPHAPAGPGLAADDARLVALREGRPRPRPTAKGLGRRGLWQHLVTNGHAMSGSLFYGRRYMKLFAYWALAPPRSAKRRAHQLRPGQHRQGADRRARLDGSTWSTPRRHPGAEPAGRSRPAPEIRSVRRVRVHLEDGRFFLHTDRALRPDHLGAAAAALGGRRRASTHSSTSACRGERRARRVATHWLPVHQVSL